MGDIKMNFIKTPEEYEKLKSDFSNKMLDRLDKYDNLSDLYTLYDFIKDDYYNVKRINYDIGDFDTEKLDNWISIRRDTKKYNL